MLVYLFLKMIPFKIIKHCAENWKAMAFSKLSRKLKQRKRGRIKNGMTQKNL